MKFYLKYKSSGKIVCECPPALIWYILEKHGFDSELRKMWFSKPWTIVFDENLYIGWKVI